MTALKFFICSFFALFLCPVLSCSDGKSGNGPGGDTTQIRNTMLHKDSLPKTDAEWKELLSDEEYRILRQKGTERPYTGQYDQFWDSGTYVCKACGAELFHSTTKFDAGCGWPSFYAAADKSNVEERPDSSHGMIRTEVVCANCGGHLGHVFDDGPDPTGMRYCINSVSLGFVKKPQ